MSCYSLADVYEIVSSFDASVPSVEDFCMCSLRLNYEPRLSLVFKDLDTVLGFIMLGVNRNQAYVIKSDFGSMDSYDCVSLLLNHVEEQFACFSKLKLLKMIVSKVSTLSKSLERQGFVCHRTLNSFELNPYNLGWEEDDNIRLVKEKITATKMRKMRAKESASELVPSFFSDDKLVFRNGYYRLFKN